MSLFKKKSTEELHKEVEEMRARKAIEQRENNEREEAKRLKQEHFALKHAGAIKTTKKIYSGLGSLGKGTIKGVQGIGQFVSTQQKPAVQSFAKGMKGFKPVKQMNIGEAFLGPAPKQGKRKQPQTLGDALFGGGDLW